MMKPKLRRFLLPIACAVLLVCVSVGATLAYLTSSAVVTNTFTVGQVTITLDETKVDAYGVADTTAGRVMGNAYKLLPGHTYTKDPVVHVAQGSEPCYLFVKVENGIAGIEATGNTMAAQMAAKGWSLVTGTQNVYAYSTVVDARTATAPVDVAVFDSFTLAGNAQVAAYANQQVVITAYAIQADGFEGKTAQEIWTAAAFE